MTTILITSYTIDQLMTEVEGQQHPLLEFLLNSLKTEIQCYINYTLDKPYKAHKKLTIHKIIFGRTLQGTSDTNNNNNNNNNKMSISSYILLQIAISMVMIAVVWSSEPAPGRSVIYSSCEDECNTNQLACESRSDQFLEHYICVKTSLACKLKCKIGGKTVSTAAKDQRRKKRHDHQHKSLKYKRLMKRFNKIKKIVFGKKRLVQLGTLRL